jgi:hypothetical protein
MRIICWFMGHPWKEDRKLSLDGLFAAFALWIPPATCRRCGAKNEPINEKYAERNGWYAKAPLKPKDVPRKVNR